MEAALEVIAKKMLYKPKPTDVPKILCRKNFPHDLTYPIHDGSWETMEIHMEGNRPVQVVTHNKGVWINTSGIAEIDDTPNNRKRLELITKGRTQVVRRIETDTVTQKEITTETEIWVTPSWEILEENILNDNFVEQVARRTLQLQAEQAANEAEIITEPQGRPVVPGELVLEKRGRGRPRVTGKSIQAAPPGATV